MSKPKNLFKLSDSVESEDSCQNSIIVKHDSNDFLEKLLNFLPTPEDELENMKKDEEILSVQINEIKEVIDKIEFRINELKIEKESLDEEKNSSLEEKNSFEEEFQDLSSKKDYFTVLLESYEADFEYTNAQKKSLGYLIDDCPEGDEKFEEQLPGLLTKTFMSTKKKMEDVNSVVKILEDQGKKNRIEECIECGLQFKDAQGKKNSLKHFHLEGFNNLKKYKPIICLECFLCLKTSVNNYNDSFFESIKDIEFEDDLSDEACKKGNKIFNSKNILNIPEFIEKGKKFSDLENKEFIENIRNEGKKSLFDSLF